MPFYIVQNDLTQMNVDAIVNAANRELSIGGGVCGAIYKAAGIPKMTTACKALSPIRTGEAVITPGFNLPAKYVIHAVGPVYNRYLPIISDKLLYTAYTSALTLCFNEGLESIAFPLISSGIYGFPQDRALKVAKNAILDFLRQHDLDVYLVVLTKSIISTHQDWLSRVKSFIEKRLQLREAPVIPYQAQPTIFSPAYARPLSKKESQREDTIQEALKNIDEPFSSFLLRLIDSKGKTDVEVYKRANIDRKLFSKIRSIPNYIPSKRTALALAIALELNLSETESLLKKAGYALSPSQVFDVIIEYFITNHHYNIYDINEVLFSYDQALLGA